MRGKSGCDNKYTTPLCVLCRTVFILSEALDEQLKTLWFSPFQTDDIETDLDMVCVHTKIMIKIFCAKLSYFLLSVVL